MTELEKIVNSTKYVPPKSDESIELFESLYDKLINGVYIEEFLNCNQITWLYYRSIGDGYSVEQLEKYAERHRQQIDNVAPSEHCNALAAAVGLQAVKDCYKNKKRYARAKKHQKQIEDRNATIEFAKGIYENYKKKIKKYKRVNSRRYNALLARKKYRPSVLLGGEYVTLYKKFLSTSEITTIREFEDAERYIRSEQFFHHSGLTGERVMRQIMTQELSFSQKEIKKTSEV